MYTYVERIWRGNLALGEEMRITNSHVCIPSAALVLTLKSFSGTLRDLQSRLLPKKATSSAKYANMANSANTLFDDKLTLGFGELQKKQSLLILQTCQISANTPFSRHLKEY